MADKNTKTQGSKQKTTKKGETTQKKVSISIDKKMYEEWMEYIEEFGYSKDGFVSDAIREKLDRDRISRVIDTMIKL